MTKKLIAATFITLLALTGCSSATVEKPTTDTTETEETTAEETAVEEPAADEGTRDNPYPIGSTISEDDWDLTVNSVTLDANEAVASGNTFNDPPADGHQYIMVNITVTYTGDDADGSIPLNTIEYVTADGNTINSYDSMAIPPEQFDSMSTLYNGASTTGNIAFAVPSDTAGEGTLAVRASMFGDKVFVAVQ